MNVINRLTAPGGIRRVELLENLVVICTHEGQEITYQRVKTTEVRHGRVSQSTVTP